MSQQNKSHTLQLQDVLKTYRQDFWKPKQTVLDHVSCTFAGGRCTGLLGHNGAGKTTSIRVMLGLVKPDSGAVLLDGKPVTREMRRTMGYMPEINKLPRTLTALEILNFHGQLMGMSGGSSWNKTMEDGLRRVDLWEHRHKQVRRMSKGMGRRLAWVQATLHQPDVLILDEPMSGLDPVGRSAMRDWINEFRQAHKTIILCTHELATVHALCDDVYILRKGKVVHSSRDDATGPIAGVRSAQATWSKFTLHVSGSSIEDLTKLQQTAGLPPWHRLSNEGWLCKIGFAEHKDASLWLQACLERGLLVTRFGDESPIDEAELLKWFGKDLNA
jgi:ABC-2 type transport system ATP-binding protein